LSHQPYVGVIIPSKIYKKMPQPPKNIRFMLSLFEESAIRNNISLCYFKLSQINPSKETVHAFIRSGNYYVKKHIPKPKVIYSRVLDHLPKYQAHIKALVDDGIHVFNRPNYDVEKYKVHEVLSKSRDINKHLPETHLVTSTSILSMMNKYRSIILKTNYGERGIGAMKLDRVGTTWILSYKLKGDLEVRTEHFTTELPLVLLTRLNKKRYIIQQTVPLATHRGNPFDMRVSVQKNKDGNFIVNGIICKVAKENDYLTNGSQGSTTCRLEDIYNQTDLQITLTVARENISDLSLRMAEFLDKYYPHLADLGFDIGITKEGVAYLIECNFISDYLSGIIINGELLAEEWRPIFTTPIDYANYLLKRSNRSF
jgi:hypothetical protein